MLAYFVRPDQILTRTEYFVTGPLSPVAKDGSRYILTISDYFTKWVEVVPTVNKMASTVASTV